MESYHGFVRTTADAMTLFEACRLGLLPKVQHRLTKAERRSIRSGSVFVWDESEAGIRRWTDGRSWSASRLSGDFLIYKEMEGRRGLGRYASRRYDRRPLDSWRGIKKGQEPGEPEYNREKRVGLIKQSFSIITLAGQHLHLISYHSEYGCRHLELPQPSSDPNLQKVRPVTGIYPEPSTTQGPPAATTNRSQTNHVGPQPQPLPPLQLQADLPRCTPVMYSLPTSSAVTSTYTHSPEPQRPVVMSRRFICNESPLLSAQPTTNILLKADIPPATRPHPAHHEFPPASFPQTGCLIAPSTKTASILPPLLHLALSSSKSSRADFFNDTRDINPLSSAEWTPRALQEYMGQAKLMRPFLEDARALRVLDRRFCV